MIDLSPYFSGENYIFYLILVGILLPYGMAVAAIAFVKTGRSPLWSLLLFTPPTAVIIIWWLAFAPWPAVDKPEKTQKD